VVLKPGQHVPPGWSAQPTWLFSSYGAFASAARSGLPKSLKAVVYDNEPVGHTPLREQLNPGKYSRKFERLAHRLGLVFIAAPTQQFLAGDAHYADVVDLQLQDRESHPRAYDRLLKYDVALVRRENRRARIVAEVTSNASHLCPTTPSGDCPPSAIQKGVDDIARNSRRIDGFWPWVYQQDGRSVRAGVSMLKDLARRVSQGAHL
jgi:hypothetical protein